MKKTLSSLALAAAVLCSPTAQAVTLLSVADNGNAVDTSFSSASQISADIGFYGAAPVLFTFLTSEDDIAAGSVSFNSIVSQLGAGETFNRVTLGLTGGALFSLVGSASSLNNAAPVSAGTNGLFENLALVSVLNPTTEVYLGDPFVEGATDWRIGFGTLKANQTFTLVMATSSTPAVPEPNSLALALAGLSALIWAAARRSEED